MSERGVALIIVLGLLAVIAAAAASGAFSEMALMRRLENAQDALKADMAARSGLALAVRLLREDGKRAPQQDDLTEDWAQPAPPFPVDEGVVLGRIEDANRFYNLNDLVDLRGRVRASEVGVAKRLFSLLKLDPGLVDALVDWIDADDLPYGPNGAEAASYIGTGVRIKNAPLDRLQELLHVRGFTPKIVRRLRAYVCVRPPTAKPRAVNLNTASSTVLRALFPAMTDADAAALIEARSYARVSDAISGRAWATGGLANRVDVKSDAFFVHVRARFGRADARWRFLLQRNGAQLTLVEAQREAL